MRKEFEEQQTVQKEQQEAQLERYLVYLESDPANKQLIINTADLLNSLGRRAAALSLIERALLTEPGDPELKFMQASVLIATRQWEDAAAVLQELMDNGIENGAVRYNLAYTRALQMQMTKARDVLQPQFETTVEQVPEAALLMTRINHYLGNLDAAEKNVKDFLAHADNDNRRSEAHGLLALVLLDRDRAREAESHAQMSVAGAPDNIEALITLATLQLAELDAAAARMLYEKVLTLQPDNGRAWLGIGLIELLNRNFDAAEAALETCVARMPAHLGSWNTLAWCQILSGKLEQAEITLQKTMEINRNFGETYGTLAVVALLRNRRKEAQELLKRATGLDKNAFAAGYAKSILLSSSGEAKSAEQLIKGLLARPLNEQGQSIERVLKRLAAKNDNTSPQDPQQRQD